MALVRVGSTWSSRICSSSCGKTWPRGGTELSPQATTWSTDGRRRAVWVSAKAPASMTVLLFSMMCRPGAGRMAFQAVWLAPSRPLPLLAPTNETQIESRLACPPAPSSLFRGDFPGLGFHGATCRPPTRVLPDPNHLQPLLGGGPSRGRRECRDTHVGPLFGQPERRL